MLSAQVPSAMIRIAPASSIRSITGREQARRRACRRARPRPRPRSRAAAAPARAPARSRPARARCWPAPPRAPRRRAPLRRRRSRAARRARRAEPLRGPVQRRDHDQAGERELPRQQEQRAGEEQQPRGGLHGLGQCVEQQRLDRVQVAGEACEHVAVAAAVERVGLEALQVAEDFARSASVKRSPTQVDAYSSPKESAAPSRAKPAIAAPSSASGASSAGTSTSSTTSLKSQISAASTAGSSAASDETGDPGLAVGPRQRPEAPDDRADAHGRRGGDQAVVVGGRGEGGGEAVEKAHGEDGGAGTGSRRLVRLG